LADPAVGVTGSVIVFTDLTSRVRTDRARTTIVRSAQVRAATWDDKSASLTGASRSW
jgi:hypothetical protein